MMGKNSGRGGSGGGLVGRVDALVEDDEGRNTPSGSIEDDVPDTAPLSLSAGVGDVGVDEGPEAEPVGLDAESGDENIEANGLFDEIAAYNELNPDANPPPYVVVGAVVVDGVAVPLRRAERSPPVKVRLPSSSDA